MYAPLFLKACRESLGAHPASYCGSRSREEAA